MAVSVSDTCRHRTGRLRYSGRTPAAPVGSFWRAVGERGAGWGLRLDGACRLGATLSRGVGRRAEGSDPEKNVSICSILFHFVAEHRDFPGGFGAVLERSRVRRNGTLWARLEQAHRRLRGPARRTIEGRYERARGHTSTHVRGCQISGCSKMRGEKGVMGPLDVGTWRDGGRSSIRLGQPGTTNSLHQATRFFLGQSFTRDTVPITVKPMRVYRRPVATQKTIASDSVAKSLQSESDSTVLPNGMDVPRVPLLYPRDSDYRIGDATRGPSREGASAARAAA